MTNVVIAAFISAIEIPGCGSSTGVLVGSKVSKYLLHLFFAASPSTCKTSSLLSMKGDVALSSCPPFHIFASLYVFVDSFSSS